jgi:hypothetical protein
MSDLLFGEELRHVDWDEERVRLWLDYRGRDRRRGGFGLSVIFGNGF